LKETEQRQSGPIALLGKLSASALLIIGFVYVMGYVIVNGYQTKYMNYGANALQLKHLAAGLLYTFLTLFVVLVLAFFILSKLIDVKFPLQSVKKKEGPEKRHRWQRALDRTRSIVRYFWAFGVGLFLAYFLIFYFFQFVGMSSPSTTSGALFVLRAILPWMGINLILSVVLAVGLYRGGIKSFESAFSGQSPPQEVNVEPASKEKEAVVAFEMIQLKRSFVEALAGRIVAPVLGLVLLLFSLVSFQGLYGRLRPDYGGGALYRVAVHLKSPSSAPSPGSVPADWKASLKSNDSWLLWVDKDETFVYVLRVDRNGNKQLLEISSGEIEAVEVLASPPISPADARFFIQ
jgi:hypothetical protein